MAAAFYKITTTKIPCRSVSYGEFGISKKKSLSTEQHHGVYDKFENVRYWLVFSIKFNISVTILFNNSNDFSYFTFKCSKRRMTGSFRLARCFGSTFVTMTVTMIEFKLLLFGAKREKRMFNNDIVLRMSSLLARLLQTLQTNLHINNSLHLARKYAGIIVRGHYLSRERSSRKTVSFEEQVMSKDKYPSIFLPQMKAIVFIILQIFFATPAVLKIGVYLTMIP